MLVVLVCFTLVMDTNTPIQNPASEKQISFINSLLEKLESEPLTTENIAKIDKRTASAMITGLLEAVEIRKATQPAPKPQPVKHPVPAGRYALLGDGEVDCLKAGVWSFFRIQTPTEGKWAGYTFLSQQASDDLYPVKGARKDEIMRLISADPRSAAVAYGRELGVCGVCNRTLTDADSIAAGIGPVCAARNGW